MKNIKYGIILLAPFLLALYITTWIEHPIEYFILWFFFALIEGFAYSIVEMMKIGEM